MSSTWIALLALWVSIELVSSSARVTSLQNLCEWVTETRTHRSDEGHLGPIKRRENWINSSCLRYNWLPKKKWEEGVPRVPRIKRGENRLRRGQPLPGGRARQQGGKTGSFIKKGWIEHQLWCNRTYGEKGANEVKTEEERCGQGRPLKGRQEKGKTGWFIKKAATKDPLIPSTGKSVPAHLIYKTDIQNSSRVCWGTKSNNWIGWHKKACNA